MIKKRNKSIEEQVEDFAKNELREFGIKYFTKTEPVNLPIDEALKNSPSKSSLNTNSSVTKSIKSTSSLARAGGG